MSPFTAPVRAFHKLAPVKWASFAERRMQRTDHLAVIGELDGIALWATRASAYLSARWHGGRTHHEALKAQNRAAAKVRAALGYSYHRDDLTF